MLPPIDSREAEGIWRSAERKNPTATLTDDAIEKCIKSWQRKQQRSQHKNNVVPLPPQNYQPTNEEQTLRQLLTQLQEEKDPIKKAVVSSQLRKFGYGDKQVKELIESSSPKQNKAKFMLPGEILTHSDGLKWLIPGLLPGLGTSFLAGSPSAGKSTLAYDLAASIKEGEEFLGEMPTETGNVLIVVSDEPLPYAQDKLISRGFYANQNNWGLLHGWDVSQWDELENAIEALHPKFILIDSFASIHRGAGFDENSTAAAGTIYKLNNLCERYNTSVLCIHHLNKNKEQRGVDKMRGSTAIAAAACAIWSLAGEGDVRTLTTPKLRGGVDTINFNITLDREEGRFKVIDGNESIQASKPIMARIRELFQRLGCEVRLEIPEILKEVGGSRDSVYKALQRLCGIGELSKSISKKDSRSKVYFLSAKYNKPTPPPPTVRSKLSNIMAETITPQGVDILDKTLDNTLDNPKNDGFVQYKTDLSNIMAESDTQQELQPIYKEDSIPCPISCPISCPIPQNDTQQELQQIPWTSTEVVEGGEGTNSLHLVTEDTYNSQDHKLGIIPPQPRYEVGDRIQCYPTEDYAERKKSVPATITEISYSDGFLQFCEIDYVKPNGNPVQGVTIGGGNYEWILRKV